MTVTKRQRLKPVLAAVAIQLCIGIAYLWSVFQTGIADSIFGGDNAKASLTFSLLLAVLSIGSVFGGIIATKTSTKRVVMIGGIILAAGCVIASFATAEKPWLIWLGYGVLAGIGMGFTYTPTIALAQKWYPEKKGLVTGVIVASLGFGGVIFAPIIEKLISNFGGVGIGETKTFLVLAAIFFVVCVVGSIFMENPPKELIELGEKIAKEKAGDRVHENFSPLQIIKKPQFYLVAAALALACMGGLMMIGFAKPIAIAKGLESTATIGVLMISMFNSLGRLLWGMMSDKIGRINTILILLVGTTALSLLVNLASGYSIYILIAAIGFMYGGFLSNFPALTSDLFGPKNMSANYGMVLLGFGVGAVFASQIAGYYKNI
ncbi:MAG: L-lactate MFS transporter, partial [Anaerovoracaceae bacterium]